MGLLRGRQSAPVSWMGNSLGEENFTISPSRLDLDSAETASQAVRSLGKFKLNELFGIVRTKGPDNLFFLLRAADETDLF